MENKDFITDDLVQRVKSISRKTEEEARIFIERYKKPVWFIWYRLEIGAPLTAPFATIES